jgi:hypothetical protein
MDSTIYDVLKILHIFQVVFWIGTDIGVAYSAWLIVKSSHLPPETRWHMGRIGSALDLVVRVDVVLILPITFSLVYLAWGLDDTLGSFGPALSALVWVYGITWSVVLVHSFLQTYRLPLGIRPSPSVATYLRTVTRVDTVIVLTILVGVLAYGATVLFADDPLSASWIKWKIFLFGMGRVAVMWFRFRPATWRTTLAEVVEHGSTPERETLMFRNLLRGQALIWFVYSTVIAATAVAVIRP